MGDPATFEIRNLYYQNAYAGCIQLALKHSPEGVVDEESLLRLVYAARAAVALGDYAQARQLLGDDATSPVAMSVLLLADYLDETGDGGDPDDAAGIHDQLVSLLDMDDSDELATEIIRYNIGLAQFSSGNALAALETLDVTGSGSSRELECIALGVHILLSIHRVDLAEKEYLAARKWGDDSLLVQFMEGWIGLVQGGRTTQQAYYVYDELSQSSNVVNTPNMVPTLIGKAVAQAAQGHHREALAHVHEAAALDPTNPLVLSNAAALTALAPFASASDVAVQERYACVLTQRTAYSVPLEHVGYRLVSARRRARSGACGVYVADYELDKYFSAVSKARNVAPFAKGAWVSEVTYTNQRRRQPTHESVQARMRVHGTHHVHRAAVGALGRVQCVGLHVRLDHVDGVHHQPEHNPCCSAGHQRHRSGQIRTVGKVHRLEPLLDNVLVRREVDAHPVALTDQRRHKPTEQALHSAFRDDSA